MSKLYETVERIINAEPMEEAENLLYGIDGIPINTKEHYQRIISMFLKKKEIVIQKHGNRLVFDLNNINDLYNIVFLAEYIKDKDLLYKSSQIEIERLEFEIKELEEERKNLELQHQFPGANHQTISRERDIKKRIIKEKESEIAEIKKVCSSFYKYEWVNLENSDKIKSNTEINELLQTVKQAVNIVHKVRSSLAHGLPSENIGKEIYFDDENFNVSIPIDYIDGYNKGRINANYEDKVILEKTNSIVSPILEELGYNLSKVESFFYNVDPDILSTLLDLFDNDVLKIYELQADIFHGKTENIIFWVKYYNYDIDKINQLGIDMFNVKMDYLRLLMNHLEDVKQIENFAFHYIEDPKSEYLIRYLIENHKVMEINIDKLPNYFLNNPIDTKMILEYLKKRSEHPNVNALKLPSFFFNNYDNIEYYLSDYIDLENYINEKNIKIDTTKLPKVMIQNKEEARELIDYMLVNSDFDVTKLPAVVWEKFNDFMRLIRDFKEKNYYVDINGFFEKEEEKLSDFIIKTDIFLRNKLGINLNYSYIYPFLDSKALAIYMDWLLSNSVIYSDQYTKSKDNNYMMYYEKLIREMEKDEDIDPEDITKVKQIYKNMQQFKIMLKERDSDLYLPSDERLNDLYTQNEGDIVKICEALRLMKDYEIDEYDLPNLDKLGLLLEGDNWYTNPECYYNYNIYIWRLDILKEKLERINIKHIGTVLSIVNSYPDEMEEQIQVLKNNGINPREAFSELLLGLEAKNSQFVTDILLHCKKYKVSRVPLSILFMDREIFNILSEEFKIPLSKWPEKVTNPNIKWTNIEQLTNYYGISFEKLDELPIELLLCDDFNLVENALKTYNSNVAKSIFGIKNPKIISLLIYMNRVFSQYKVENAPDVDLFNLQDGFDIHNFFQTTLEDTIDYRNNITAVSMNPDLYYDQFGQYKYQNFEVSVVNHILHKMRNSSEHYRIKPVRDNEGNLVEDKVYLYDEDNLGRNNFNIVLSIVDALKITRMVEKALNLDLDKEIEIKDEEKEPVKAK